MGKSDKLTDEEYLERFKVGNSEDYPLEQWPDVLEQWKQEDKDESQ
jgi:hypothetical protein